MAKSFDCDIKSTKAPDDNLSFIIFCIYLAKRRRKLMISTKTRKTTSSLTVEPTIIKQVIVANRGMRDEHNYKRNKSTVDEHC